MERGCWDNLIYITSVSKKLGQSAVVYYYCALSQFFWNRRYSSLSRKKSIQPTIFYVINEKKSNLPVVIIYENILLVY